MKLQILIIIGLVPFFLFSQEKDTLVVDINQKIRNEFIKDHTKQLNIKLELSNDVQSYNMPFENREVRIRPNLGLRYAIVLSYKFLSVRLGIRAKPSPSSENDKGSPENFRLKFQLLFDKWSHHFEYNRVKGYYITDSKINSTQEVSNHIQFPDLVSNVFLGTSAYKLNDNYSVRSTISQTEIQLKSAGSFIPSINYWYYDFDGLEKMISPIGDEIVRDNYISSSKGIDFVLNVGYYYTFVYKHWYANVFANVGGGIDFNSTKRINGFNTIENKNNEFVASIQGGAGIGYNAEKIFFGASFDNRTTNEKYNSEKMQFNTSKNSFYVFFGYRFRAPKVISKPVDGIEEKIPILKKG